MLSDRPRSPSSTQSIYNLLPDYEIVELPPEEEFELCERVSSEEMKAFEEKKAALPITGAYQPDDLNRIALTVFKKNFTYEESCSHPTFATLNYHVLKDGAQKIILCGAATEVKTQKDLTVPSLEDTFNFLKEHNIYRPEDIVLIPIIEPYRGWDKEGHFRLLALVNDSISYYDSKRLCYQRAMRFLTPARTATELTLEEAALQMVSAVGFLQKLKLLAKTVVTIGYRYTDYFDRVKNICKEYFPNMSFSEYGLAQQAWNNHTQCGPNTIETGLKVAKGINPETDKPRAITVGGR